MKQRDLIGVIEAAYATERDAGSWLTELHEALSPIVDVGLGSCAYRYDLTSKGLRVAEVVEKNAALDVGALMKALTTLTRDYVGESFRALPCGLASEVPGFERQPALTVLQRGGVGDLLVINAFDPAGRGVCVSAFRPEGAKISARTRTLYNRVSSHIAAGARLRDLPPSASPPPEAVVTPAGRVVHAEGDTKTRAARAALAEAARAVDRARGSLRHRDPEQAVAGWRGLVSARWSLVDHFDRDGRHYLLARANTAATADPLGLTPRAREILTYAALGHHNKLIAYELGLAPATVRVVLMRAARRLGTRTRSATVEAYVALTRGAPREGRPPEEPSEERDARRAD